MQSSTEEKTSRINVFNLIVQLTFIDEESSSKFVNAASPYIDYVRLSEPNTIMYTLMKSDKNPLLYNFIERYLDKERDYIGTHRSSQQFKTFRSLLTLLQESGKVSISGNSYIDL
mmetsp:Transcript_57134/g.66784  ORF Transcript_57134/g.66784 Transcript_57134/m.66784 type:complete len:115 (-) Transcript_57134:210-554(-)